MIRLTLPSLPPPLSACFTNVARNGRAKTPAYKAWEAEARIAIMQQRPTKITGPVRVEYVLCKPSRRKMDLANREKALSDILVSCGVIEDDSMIEDLRLAWGGVDPVTVFIAPIDGLAFRSPREGGINDERRGCVNTSRLSNRSDP